MKIFDLHNDLLTVNDDYLVEMNSYPEDTSVALAIYKGKLTFTELQNLVEKYKNNPHKNGYLAYEDIGYEGISLDYIINSNPLYVSLTHNPENQFGYGVDNNMPLKKKGIEAVRELSKNGVVLDVAHLAKKGAIDLLNNADRVICSHASFNGVHHHDRNLDDDIMAEIVRRNGIVALTFVGFFLTDENKEATILDVIKHIDYFANKFSINNLSVGTDFNGTDSLPINLKTYKEFENLKNELIKRGYSENDVDKIFYQNAYNYFFKNC